MKLVELIHGTAVINTDGVVEPGDDVMFVAILF
jgi:hypothetical protein